MGQPIWSGSRLAFGPLNGGHIRYLPLATLILALACSTQQPSAGTDNHAADEAKIRGLDSAWSKAAADRNVDQAVAVYADDAAMLEPGEPVAIGKTAIRAGWANMLGLPGAVLTFGPDKIDVSGDRAVELGTYALTSNDKAGKPQTTKAKYVVIWGKQPDGSWKVLVDVTTTTQ